MKTTEIKLSQLPKKIQLATADKPPTLILFEVTFPLNHAQFYRQSLSLSCKSEIKTHLASQSRRNTPISRKSLATTPDNYIRRSQSNVFPDKSLQNHAQTHTFTQNLSATTSGHYYRSQSNAFNSPITYNHSTITHSHCQQPYSNPSRHHLHNAQ